MFGPSTDKNRTRRKRSIMRFLLLLLVVAGVDAKPTANQPIRIVATVIDKAEGTWAEATVALINTKTLEMQKAVTDSKGEARFSAAPGVRYTLIAVPPKRFTCAEAGIKTVFIRSGENAKIRLVIGLEHCGIVE